MSWKDNLIKIEPYVAGEQPDKTDFIKLNANENPYPPAPGVIRAIEQFRGGSLKKYPDANAKPLADALAARFGLERGNVFLGNGSDDVLALCFRAFFQFRQAGNLSGHNLLVLPGVVRHAAYPV